MQTQSKEISRTAEARQELKKRSVSAKKCVENGAFDSVNEALISMHMQENPDIKEMKTFNQWKQEGKFVKKGEKGFAIWGKPVKVEREKPKKGEESEFEMFPVAFLFSNLQVK